MDSEGAIPTMRQQRRSTLRESTQYARMSAPAAVIFGTIRDGYCSLNVTRAFRLASAAFFNAMDVVAAGHSSACSVHRCTADLNRPFCLGIEDGVAVTLLTSHRAVVIYDGRAPKEVERWHLQTSSERGRF